MRVTGLFTLLLLTVIGAFGVAGTQAATQVDRSLQLRLDAISSDPQEPRNHFNLGLEYYNRNEFDLASKAFQKALKVGKKNKEAHAAVDMDCYQILGDIYLRKQQNKIAANWFAKGLKKNPNDSVCLFGRGQAFFLAKNYKSAKKALALYLSVVTVSGDPKDAREAPTALTYLGAMAMEKKKFDEAAGHFRKVIKSYPKDSKEAKANLAIVLLTKGDKLARKNKLSEALVLYDESVLVDPKNLSALKASARTHFDVGMNLSTAKNEEERKGAVKHFKHAERNFLRATKVDKNDFQCWYYAGLSQFQLEKYVEMVKSYNRSVKINPDQPAARYNLALALYRQQLYEEALAQAEQAKRLSPKDRDTNALLNNIFDAYKTDCMNKGSEAISSDRFQEAISWWEKALELDPHNPDAPQYIEKARTRMAELIAEHTQKGDAAYRRKNLLAASNEWNAAIQLDPDNDDLRKKLAKVSKGKRVLAIVNQAKASYNAKDYQAATARVKQALAISPKDAGARALMKRIRSKQLSGVRAMIVSARKYLRSGKLLPAKRKLQRAREASPKSKTVRQLLLEVNSAIVKAIEKHELAAATAMSNKNKKAAQKSYEKILALNPNHADASKAIKKLTGKASKITVDAARIKKLNKQGIFAYMQNNLKGAEKAWASALAIDPNNIEIKRSLERVRLKMKTRKVRRT